MASYHDNLIVERRDAMKGDIEWIPLGLTLVEYPKGDLLGKFFALISLSPFGIVSGFVTLILFRRDLHTISFFLGVISNEFINQLLKHLICEPRPMHRVVNYGEHGMPSAHAQFSWFFTTYVIYFIFIRLHHMHSNTIENFWRLLVVIGCILGAVVVTIGRVYLQYHTWRQVIYGAIIGVLFATVWFFLVHQLATPYFPLVASWKVSEMLLVRDTSLIPNVLWFEYTTSRQESRARSRKLVSMKSQ